MSEPLDEAPEVDDALPDGDAPAMSAIEEEALAMGWKPRDAFKGDDEKFVTAEEYVERGKTIMPFLRKELAKAHREIDSLKKAVTESATIMSRAEKRAYDRARADLEIELHNATIAQDTDAVRAVTRDIVNLEREVSAGPKPEAGPQAEAERLQAEFEEANPWFKTDAVMRGAAIELSAELQAEGFTGKALGREIARRIREDFPHKFRGEKPAENPNRRLPGAVEGQTAPRTRGKTFSDLPPEAKETAAFFEKSVKGFNRDKFVKDYFAEQNR